MKSNMSRVIFHQKIHMNKYRKAHLEFVDNEATKPHLTLSHSSFLQVRYVILSFLKNGHMVGENLARNRLQHTIFSLHIALIYAVGWYVLQRWSCCFRNDVTVPLFSFFCANNFNLIFYLFIVQYPFYS